MPRIDDYKMAIALAAGELQKINPKRLANSSRAQYFWKGAKGAKGAGKVCWCPISARTAG